VIARAQRRKQRGSAAIEFALILLPFALLLFGMIDYGWYLYVDMASTNAAREAARAAITIAGACPNTAAISAGETTGNSYLSGLLPSSYSPDVDGTCTTLPSGDPQFQFTVRVNFQTLTGSSLVPMPGGSAGSASVFTSATMRGVP